jgi:hypothetical protein
VLVGSVACVCASAQSFSIEAYITSAGSPARAISACFRVDAVIGEAELGTSSGGKFTLLNGYSSPTSTHDDIFFNAFEACTP